MSVRRMKFRAGAVGACVAMMAMSTIAQDVNLTGTVTDGGGSAIAGPPYPLVRLRGVGEQDYCDDAGAYAIARVSTVITNATQSAAKPTMRANQVLFTLAKAGQVSVSAYELNGSEMSRTAHNLQAGSYAITTLAVGAPATYLVNLEINGRRHSFKCLSISANVSAVNVAATTHGVTASLAKTLEVVDTLSITRSGYVEKRLPVETLVGTMNASLDRYYVMLNTDGNGSVNPSGQQSYVHNQTVTISATPHSGWTFKS